MTRRATGNEAAALLRPTDTLAMPLGPGQPPVFLQALGRRTDREHLRVGGALLTVLTDLFSHPGVHYLSGFSGPLERMLRYSGANLGFAPADFRRGLALAAIAHPDFRAGLLEAAERAGGGRSPVPPPA